MTREEILYLLPYLFSLTLSLGIFFYTWRHRYVRGARMYSWYVGGQTLTILGFIFELISPNLQTKILWDKFQWLTVSFLVLVPFLLFSIQYSEYKLRYPRITWVFWIGIPVLFTLFLLTDSRHHRIYPNPHLSADHPFPELVYDFTSIVYIYSVIYIYGVTLYGLSLLIRPHSLYRSQYLIIAAGFFIPLALSTFSLANIRIAPQRDVGPFSLALGNLVVAWGLFRYRSFDIVPIARERIVENLRDPVVVLDAKNRVADANQAALKMLHRDISQVISHSSREIFARWPIIVGELEFLDTDRQEIVVQEGEDTFYYDVNVSPIYNAERKLLGRIVAARDITRYKTLEIGYRLLSEELEQRVRERTEELRQSAEQYRAVVENQTEFIVRWTPDRTRTFVNEAYCRYFELTREQAVQIDFLSHIVEEDQEAVLQKISRLISGTAEVETDIHRVIKPDGSIGWQEWTDQAIHDEAGQIVEFQSVGRDVTERKHAEQALRESEAIYRKAIEVAGAVPYRQTYYYYKGFHLHIIYDFIGEGIQQITGYRPEEITEDLWDSLVKETVLTGDLSKYSWGEAIERVRSGRNPVWQCEHRIQTRDGEARWIYEVAVELRDKDGLSHGSIGLYQDITTRKQAEVDLRESEERFAILSTATFEAIGLSEQGKIIDVNEQMLAMFGYTRAEMIRMDVANLIAPESLNIVTEHRVAGSEDPYEHVAIKKDGTVFPVEVRPRTIPYKGQPIRVTAIRDITERKQAEEALRKSEERFSKAFQASPIIITIFRLTDGKLLEVNETFEKISGYTREEAIGRIELGFWANQADRRRIISILLAEGKIRNAELQFRIKNGSILTSLCSAEIIELSGEKCVIAVIEDITERKNSEARILRLNRLYVTISQINQTIVHARDRDSLFHEICRVAIEHGRFRMAWIGLIDAPDSLLKPIVFAGEELGYLDNLKIDIHDMTLGQGPTGTAIREGHCVICLDIANDPRMAPWREQALSRGYGSSAAVPLHERERVIGALTVYAAEPQGFDAEDEELLEQIGQDVSFALDSINAETKRKQAEAILLHQLAFDELLTRLLARFATCSYEEVDSSIEIALQEFAEFLGSELADLIVLSKDKTSWNSSHKWVTPQLRDTENSKLSIPSGKLTWSENQLLAGHAIVIKTLHDYPAEAVSDREFSEAQGIKSILTVPISGLEKQVFGCIDIVAYNHQINWLDSDISHLGLIGDAIANLLERKHAEENLAEAYDTTLEGWAKALELRDKETEGHSRRVTETTLAVARAMGLPETELVHIRRGALLHDIGKMGIPDGILHKNGPLTSEDRTIVEKHPDTAFNLLKTIPYLSKALDIPYCHHEKWDGSGYPRGLKGEEIPLAARIFAIVDVWDALSSDRPYRKAWDKEQVIAYLKNESDKHFDPNALNIFLEMVEQGEI